MRVAAGAAGEDDLCGKKIAGGRTNLPTALQTMIDDGKMLHCSPNGTWPQAARCRQSPSTASHRPAAMTQTEAPKRRILVINPSSSLAVTKVIDAAVHLLRIAGGPEVEVDCLREEPAGSRRSATPTA
jgi:hypothetical protein